MVTRRAVVRFMVAAVDPRLGETVLDPACGSGAKAGRAAVVVPNGTLFGDGICIKIKEELLGQCSRKQRRR